MTVCRMAHEILIVTESELKQAVRLNLDAVDCVEKAFLALATGNVVMPPILSMELAEVNGEVDVKTAYIPGFDGFAIKISPGFFDNPKLGLPSVNGLMILFSAKTGMVDALFLDNGYLTDVRTAAAGAVAAKHLAPDDVNTVGVMGTGVQARLQVEAARLVRSFSKVLVWGRDDEKAVACAGDLSNSLGIEVVVETNPAKLVEQSQLVITTTPSREPILKSDWLHSRLHITAMGSDQTGKGELDPKALLECDCYVADRVSQCKTSGELEAALEAGLWDRGDPAELGDIISGKVQGRRSKNDVTICDLTGTGAQDTAIATLALDAILSSGTGRKIAT